MRYALFIIGAGVLFSCSDQFINHKLRFEKLGNCPGVADPVKLTRNINGTRYEFTSCLNDGFDGKNYSVSRQGDTLIVDFPRAEHTGVYQYKLILDIDAKPAYHHLILDGRDLNMNGPE